MVKSHHFKNNHIEESVFQTELTYSKTKSWAQSKTQIVDLLLSKLIINYTEQKLAASELCS
jgi:hypothetical protein